MAQIDELLTIEEAAQAIGVTPGWLRQLRGNGRGPVSWRAGRRLMFPRSGIDIYIARQREASTRGGTL